MLARLSAYLPRWLVLTRFFSWLRLLYFIKYWPQKYLKDRRRHRGNKKGQKQNKSNIRIVFERVFSKEKVGIPMLGMKNTFCVEI